jgi:hypothetical protein
MASPKTAAAARERLMAVIGTLRLLAALPLCGCCWGSTEPLAAATNVRDCRLGG